MSRTEAEEQVETRLRHKQTLEGLDKAAFSWMHVRNLIINGTGFFMVEIRLLFTG
jgi:hypothetical protein